MVGGRRQSLRGKNLNWLIDAGGWQTLQFESQKLNFFLLMAVGGRRQSLTAKNLIFFIDAGRWQTTESKSQKSKYFGWGWGVADDRAWQPNT